MEINDYPLILVFWNIFLAFLPCWAVYFLATHSKLRKNRVIFALIFLFWLAMLPNTAYLFLMVRHLVDYCADYDVYRVCRNGSWVVLFFFTYGLIGLPTFYYALSKMTDIVAQKWGKQAKKLFPLTVIPLTSVGLMFGLYERFNSWDILKKPLSLLGAVTDYFNIPFLTTDFLVFTFTLYLIYYVTDFFWKLKR
ncbi:DUF1361 domain-containing protein [Patescibacteria group bacterium]|nr:DUF1361 domain-containing protein [Patescibacteria group bacterium]MBU1015605.1 DUF1361 domain-containing protein [Patescibacteria group bacterium]MBU1685012.1 DUF1361 domain-containing protein [Patescibacteria group bacterium]MBU1938118.1 DUF1361 domain-containing protein [Patescibacteria group bacterium]